MSEEKGSTFNDLKARTYTRRDVLKGAAVVGAAVGFGPLAAACGGGSTSGSPSPSGSGSAAGTPKKGGELRAGLIGGSSSNTTDPTYEITESDAAREVMCYECLNLIKADGTIEMLLAESMTPNKDATEWVIKLKSGITWHDGKDFTANDVAYTYNFIAKNKKNGANFLSLVDLPAMKVEDNLTLRVPMKVPYSTFVQVQPTWFLPIVYDGYDPKKPPNGTGPFKITGFSPQQTVLERNPNYWQSPKPYLDKVTIVEFADETAMTNAFLGGVVDTISLLSADQITSLEGQGKKVVISEGGGMNPFTMNTQVAPFNDVRVRQAMRLLVDRKQMLDLVFKGNGTVGNDVTSRWDPAYDTSIPQREQDIEQAKSLLKAAGHENFTTELVCAEIAMGVTNTAQVFAQQAKAAGVTINLRKTTVTDFYGPQFLKYPFAFDYWGFQYYLPQVASELQADSPYPESHWDNPQTNKLYGEALATTDEAKRAEICHEMQKIDHDIGGLIIPYFPPVIDAYNANLQGVVPSKIGASWNNFDFMSYWLA
jgi:peptide/nickel transport system substrate-binding protein